MDGTRTHDQKVIAAAFLDFYKGLLGTRMENRQRVYQGVLKLGPSLTKKHTEMLMRGFTKEDVKAVVFSIPGNKSPGQDGFSSFFYQDNWGIIGEDVGKVVLSFLNLGNILKEINSTIITSVPKVKCPSTVKDLDQLLVEISYIRLK